MVSDFLDRLIERAPAHDRTGDRAPILRPRLAALFEPSEPGESLLSRRPVDAGLTVEERLAEDEGSWDQPARPGRRGSRDEHEGEPHPRPLPIAMERGATHELQAGSPSPAHRERGPGGEGLPAYFDQAVRAANPARPAGPTTDGGPDRPLAVEQRVTGRAGAAGDPGLPRPDQGMAPPAPQLARLGELPSPRADRRGGTASTAVPVARGDLRRAGEPPIYRDRPAGSLQRIEAAVSGESRPARTPATIVVTIGRIEVRAPASPPTAQARPRQPAVRREPSLSLDAYLDRRNASSRSGAGR